VAELRVEHPSVVVVLASREACDAFEAPDGVTPMRIAPRELMLVDAPGVAEAGVPSGSVPWVEDVSDAWVALVLEGVDAAAAFARLSELELPADGWIQGEVAKAPAKVLVAGDRVTVLVPAMLAIHVEDRIRTDAAEVLGS
jgi:hypothetical protein